MVPRAVLGSGAGAARDSPCIGSVFVGHMSLIGALAIEYFLADGGESCSAACAKVSPVALACDLRAITAAAASVATCNAVLSALDMRYTTSAMYSDDDSGCTYHPGQTGWAQVMHSGLDSGATPAPTCDEVNADPGRRRVCACKEVAAETPEPTSATATATLVRTLGQPRANYNPSLADLPDLKDSGVNVERETFKSVEVTFTLTQQGGVAEAETRKAEMTSEAMRTLIADSMKLGAAQSLDVSLDLVTPPRPPPTPPPMPPSSPPPLAPPPPPSPPPSTETVVVRLTAFGTVEDYTPDVIEMLEKNMATVAGVDASLVSITVAPGSVLITATIAVPAAMQSYGVRNLIKAELSDPEAASAALGITVASVPDFEITSATTVYAIVDTSAAQDQNSTDKPSYSLILGLVFGIVLTGLAAAAVVWKYRSAQAAKKTLERNVAIDASAASLPVNPV